MVVSHPTTFGQIALQNYISLNLVQLLLKAGGFISCSIGKEKPDTISQELPHLSITKSIHGSDLHVHRSPYSYAEPAPTYPLDHILSHFLKDFDSEMIPLPISLVSHSLQNYFQQHVNKLYCLLFLKKKKNPPAVC